MYSSTACELDHSSVGGLYVGDVCRSPHHVHALGDRDLLSQINGSISHHVQSTQEEARAGHPSEAWEVVNVDVEIGRKGTGVSRSRFSFLPRSLHLALENWYKNAKENVALLPVTSSHVQGLLSSCLEFGVFLKPYLLSIDEASRKRLLESKGARKLAVFRSLCEQAALNFLSEYWQYLDVPRCLLICNHRRHWKCVDKLLQSTFYERDAERDTLRKSVESCIGRQNLQRACSQLSPRPASNLFFLLTYLPKFFKSNSKITAAFCADLYPWISPENVGRTLGVLPLKTPVPGTPASASMEYYIGYLNRLMETQPRCRDDIRAVHLWVESSLRLAPPPPHTLFHNGVDARDGLAKGAWKRCLEWKEHCFLKHIVDNPRVVPMKDKRGGIRGEQREGEVRDVDVGVVIGKVVYRYDEEYLLRLFTKHGYYYGVAVLWERQNCSQLKVVSLMVEADDWLSLCGYMQQPATSKDTWRHLLSRLSLLKRQEAETQGERPDESTNESESTREISIERVLGLLFFTFSTHEAIALSSQFPELQGRIPLQAFQCSVERARAHQQQQKVVHALLEKVDSYYWGQKTAILAPQLAMVRQTEMEGNILSLPFVKKGGSGAEGVCKLTIDHDTPIPRYVETLHTHWGAETQLGWRAVCGICVLPIPEEIGLNVTVFQCGHAFHEACIGDNPCTSCLNTKLESVHDDRWALT